MGTADLRLLARSGCLVLACVVAACGGGSTESPPRVASALKTDVRAFSGHGVYWNPAEPGTGFFFEAQAGSAIATFYAYTEDGRPVWYTGEGQFKALESGK